MSVRHLILNFSGFFSITSLQGTTWRQASRQRCKWMRESMETSMCCNECLACTRNRPLIKEVFLPSSDYSNCVVSVVSRCAWPVQGWKQAAGAEHHRAHRQHGSPLIDPVQVAPRHIGHADGPRRAVHKLIPVPAIETEDLNNCTGMEYKIRFKGIFPNLLRSHSLADFVVEPGDALVGPVFTQRWQDVTQGVWPTAWQERVKNPQSLKIHCFTLGGSESPNFKS